MEPEKTEQANPWKEFMQKYDIIKNHQTGVRVDLGGEITDLNGNTFKYPKGKCPVFGKTIAKNGTEMFLTKNIVEEFSKDRFLNDAKTGYIHLLGSIGSNSIQFPIFYNNNYYSNWTSRIHTNSILECSKHANKFEHLIKPLSDNDNCILDNNKGKCIKQPFIYNLKDKTCYILYTLHQYKFRSGEKYIYSVKKKEEDDHFVFGSANIRNDWINRCPIKPIKGAVFGKWKKNKCKRMKNINSAGSNYGNASHCGRTVFNTSPSDARGVSYGFGVNWGSFSSTTGCQYYNTVPNCLIYDNTAYSVTSLSMTDLKHFDLPPCFHESEGWKIEATCGNAPTQIYTCTNNVWVGSGGNNIFKCKSPDEWANIREDVENPKKKKGKRQKREQHEETQRTQQNEERQRIEQDEGRQKIEQDEGRQRIEQDEGRQKIEQDEERQKIEQDEGRQKIEQNKERQIVEQNKERQKIDQDEERQRIDQDEERQRIDQDEKRQKIEQSKGTTQKIHLDERTQEIQQEEVTHDIQEEKENQEIPKNEETQEIEKYKKREDTEQKESMNENRKIQLDSNEITDENSINILDIRRTTNKRKITQEGIEPETRFTSNPSEESTHMSGEIRREGEVEGGPRKKDERIINEGKTKTNQQLRNATLDTSFKSSSVSKRDRIGVSFGILVAVGIFM